MIDDNQLFKSAHAAMVSKTCVKCGSLFKGIRCKECRREYGIKYRLNNAEKIKELSERLRKCRQCETIFNGQGCKVCKNRKAAQYRMENADLVKANMDKWHSENIERFKDCTAKYRAKNQIKIREWMIKFRIENPEKIRAYGQKYRAINLEKIKAYDKMRCLVNPEARRIHRINRKFRLKESGGKLSKDLTQRLFKLQRGKCPCCGIGLDANFHLDHIIPLALGGKNIDSNIQLLRATCNLQKNARHPNEFMRSRGFLI